MVEPLSLDLFDFTLPQRCIAQVPARPRDASRLLVLPRDGGPWQHQRFTDLPQWLQAGDVLVINRTQVIPARLRLRLSTGGKAELLLHRPVDGSLEAATTWEGLGRPGSALRPERVLTTAAGRRLVVMERDGPVVRVRHEGGALWPVLEAEGVMPLPPYIARSQSDASTDAEDYQSIFAQERGAVAAPTASLHFTDRVLAALQSRGVTLQDVVLHVGPGTFLPVRDEHRSDVRQHVMHAEWYDVPAATQAAIHGAHQHGKRVIAVGTTSLRALETWASTQAARGESRLFVYPGFQFRVVHGLVTNFHLPRSTLLLLVAAMAGRERILAAYADAIALNYRFYSYGDAMLII